MARLRDSKVHRVLAGGGFVIPCEQHGCCFAEKSLKSVRYTELDQPLGAKNERKAHNAGRSLRVNSLCCCLRRPSRLSVSWKLRIARAWMAFAGNSIGRFDASDALRLRLA